MFLDLKSYNLSFKWSNFFLNSEVPCFTLLSNLVKNFLCQTLRGRPNLEKSDLIYRTTYQFCILDSFDTCLGVSIRRATVIRRFEYFAWLPINTMTRRWPTDQVSMKIAAWSSSICKFRGIVSFGQFLRQ